MDKCVARFRGRQRLSTRLILSVIGCLSLFHSASCPLTFGQETQPASSPDPGRLDVLVLGPLRPLVLRLDVAIDGKPFHQARREQFDRHFERLDADKDQKIDAKSAREIWTLLTGQVTAEAAADATQLSPLDQLLAQHQGIVPSEELYKLLLQIAPSVQLQEVTGVAGLQAAILPLLDENGDLQVSVEEMAASRKRLLVRDFDNNEILTAEELAFVPDAVGRLDQQEENGPQAKTRSASVVLLTAGDTAERVRDLMLARYDRNGDQKLDLNGDQAELVLPQDLKNSLDRDQNGVLDADEAREYGARKPDAELKFQLGRTRTERTTVRDRGKTEPRREGVVQVRRRTSGNFTLDAGEVHLEFRRNNRKAGENAQGGYRLRNFDADQNGYLDAKESEAEPQIKAGFATMDENQDGMVVSEEFEKYFRNQRDATAARIVLVFTDLGQDLFSLLDADKDGRLTQRELIAAPKSITSVDRDANQKLSSSEIPQQLHLELARGTGDGQSGMLAAGQRTRAEGSMSEAGPDWFNRMDRNGDGDLSRREFLGSLEKFNELDSDHDELLSVAEATAGSAAPAAGTP